VTKFQLFEQQRVQPTEHLSAGPDIFDELRRLGTDEEVTRREAQRSFWWLKIGTTYVDHTVMIAIGGPVDGTVAAFDEPHGDVARLADSFAEFWSALEVRTEERTRAGDVLANSEGYGVATTEAARVRSAAYWQAVDAWVNPGRAPRRDAVRSNVGLERLRKRRA
jgi:hypothetical protein